MPGKVRVFPTGGKTNMVSCWPIVSSLLVPANLLISTFILSGLKQLLGNLVPQMRHVCDLRADLSQLRRSLTKETGPNGTEFWKVVFKVAVMFGGTRLQARLLWEEGVRIHATNASALYFISGND